MPRALLLSCEHASRAVPARYRAWFRGARRVLESHRGFDRGALPLARGLARELRAPLIAARATRLLVDLNRSAHHRALLSEYVPPLGREAREALLAEQYWPYRKRIERALSRPLGTGRGALHVSVHSFTPRLAGAERSADVGLLYDPSRAPERTIAHAWRQALRARGPWRVRLNYPYRGTADGLTTALRKQHGPRRYAGLELEVNQSFFAERSPQWRALERALLESLKIALGDSGNG